MKKIVATSLVALSALGILLAYPFEKASELETIAVMQAFDAQEDARIRAIDEVSDAIVGIVNMQQGMPRGEGSGVIYKVEESHTYIVTNEHVISGGDGFEVVFANGDRYEATLIGADVYTDLAVLKLEDYEASTIATFGHTEELLIGQTVIAIGNPLGLRFAGSATSGIVSGHNRTINVHLQPNNEEWEMTVLQTDTAINPGNSGGALINLEGEVVGINSMKIASSSIEGMSFSIPTYVALPIINDLEENGQVLRPTLGVTGIDMGSIPDRLKAMINIPLDQRTGVFVNTIQKGSLAEKMGMKTSDVIIAMGDLEVGDTLAFTKELFNYSEGQTLTIVVLRGNEKVELTTTITVSSLR